MTSHPASSHAHGSAPGSEAGDASSGSSSGDPRPLHPRDEGIEPLVSSADSAVGVPHIGPPIDERLRREKFDVYELAMALSHYDLGVLHAMKEFPRGSRKAPKLRLKTQQAEYLLKRRAPGHDDPYRVAFAHSIQLHLQERGFPVAGLLGTREDNNSMLQMNGRVYEMFHFVHGRDYDHSPTATELAGTALGRLHRLLSDHRSEYEGPRGSYHAVPTLDKRFSQVPDSITRLEPKADHTAIERLSEVLRKAYHEATRQVDDAGFRTWPSVYVHGDWHPGNLLYRDKSIAAVLDFDSARLEPRMSDVANAVLQFSMMMGNPEDPLTWPEGLDLERIQRMLRGYQAGFGQRLDEAELKSLPWLIVEALIVESVVPIAVTGSFARISGSAFLGMVEKKIRWIQPRIEKIMRLAGG